MTNRELFNQTANDTIILNIPLKTQVTQVDGLMPLYKKRLGTV